MISPIAAPVRARPIGLCTCVHVAGCAAFRKGPSGSSLDCAGAAQIREALKLRAKDVDTVALLHESATHFQA